VGFFILGQGKFPGTVFGRNILEDFCEESSWELPRTEQFGKKKGL
jgi:hypothetical protein